VMESGRPLIELRQVSKRFTLHQESQRSFQETFIRFLQRKPNPRHDFWSLQDVSFEVKQGDSFGIIGPNGSGKSTLLKLISGILEPTSGDIFTQGRIASLLELGAGFHPDLTGRENIFLNGSVVGLSRRQIKQRLDEIIDFAELGEFIDVPIRHYSSGMYVRLGFAVAIHTDPDILLVDEVLSVGDVSFQHKCLDGIRRFREGGGTLVLVSHDLGTIQSLSNAAIWLDRGVARDVGRPVDVVMAYLNDVADKAEARAATKPLPELEGVRRWGTGKVQITRVELCDRTGTPRTLFVNGGAMEIRLSYFAEQRVEDPVFGIAIHHANGTHVCGPNTGFDGLHIPCVEGEGQVTYFIPALPFIEGEYLVSVSSHNRADDEMYDYHDRAYPFRVHPGASRERYGLIALGGEWRLDSCNDMQSERSWFPSHAVR
jgi:ABC-type polysaccharide/polyol phosphate transport system ATPase subunit